MFDQLPKMFGGKAAVRNEDNVTPLRDTEPTRPMRFQHNPQPPYGAYGPPMRIHTHEMDKAKTIFLALVDERQEARDRISEQVLTLLKMYPNDERPHPEGSPV